MAEFDRATVVSQRCRGVFRHFSMANKVIIGTQHTVKTPVAIASVQVTRTSMRETNFAETVRAVSCFVFFLWWSRTTTIRKWNKKILKPLKEKITNPIRSKTGLEPVGMILDKTELTIGRDHDAMSITLSPPFSMKILWRSGNATATKRSILNRNKMEEWILAWKAD